MRRPFATAALALLCVAAHAENAPAPAPAPDGYVRAMFGAGPAQFVMWRPADGGRILLVVAEEEPAVSARNRPDLLQIALTRKMSVLFAGAGAALKDPLLRENLRKFLATLKPKKIGAGVGPGADALRDLEFETPSKPLDALLLADLAAPAPVAKDGPFVVELYGSDAFWRATPRATSPPVSVNGRRFFVAGATFQRSGEANCAAPINMRDGEPARRVLLADLDDYLRSGAPLPMSREAELITAKSVSWPKVLGLPAPPTGERLIPKIDVDGNEASGLRLPDQALPVATFTGWNASKEKAPGACAAGTALPFPPNRAARDAAHDPRQSLVERYGARSYFVAALRSVADKLVKERLLLPQDAEAYVAAGKQAPF